MSNSWHLFLSKQLTINKVSKKFAGVKSDCFSRTTAHFILLQTKKTLQPVYLIIIFMICGVKTANVS